MAEAKWIERETNVSLGRVASATLGGEVLYLVRHRDLATFRFEEDELVPWHEPISATQRM